MRKKRKSKAPRLSLKFLILTLLSGGMFLFAAVSSYGSLHEPLRPKAKEEDGLVLGTKVKEATQSSQTAIPAFVKPKREKLPPLPGDISALSFVVYDVKEKKVLAQKNSDMALPPASTTKIMTALIVLEEYDLDEKVIVPSECVGLPGSNVYFKAGEKLSVQSLLYGMLLPSAADAACTLARAGGNPYEFLAKMNLKARMLGLKHTNFDNVIGYDSEKNHYSSANDLVIMAKEAMKSAVFRKIVGTSEYVIRSYNSDNVYPVRNTNELLQVIPGTVGVKTGYTEKAHGCLVYAYENKGKSVIIVVMGSKERFTDTEKLLNWYLKI